MATISAKRIKDALKKVQRVGRIEEAATIAGCELTLQNLSPPEFESALAAIEGLEDVAYAHGYQLEQVSRSIVEIDGHDLRDAEYIEDEVPVGQYLLELVLPNKAAAEAVAAKLREQKLSPVITQQGSQGDDVGLKTVRVERHQWLKENVLKDWSREALTVAWRKFTEVLIKADDAAKRGVSFLIPDETAEDKYRRLLNDLKETENELPDELVNRVLDDAGLLKKARREELDAVNERLGQLREAPPQPAPVADPMAPQPSTPPTPPATPPEAIQQAMSARPRLNQHGAEVPVPVPQTEHVPVPAAPRAKVPDQIRRAAMQNAQGIGAQPQPQGNRRQNRADEIAALEAQVDPALGQGTVVAPHMPEVAELSNRTPAVDPQGVRSIIDKPPVVGINPRFRPRGT